MRKWSSKVTISRKDKFRVESERHLLSYCEDERTPKDKQTIKFGIKVSVKGVKMFVQILDQKFCLVNELPLLEEILCEDQCFSK